MPWIDLIMYFILHYRSSRDYARGEASIKKNVDLKNGLKRLQSVEE